MKAHKLLGIIICLTMLFTLADTVSAAASKVDVCHLDKDTGTYHKINISESAFQSHLDHGDAKPGIPGSVGDPVPGNPNYKFGPECELVPEHFTVATVTVYPNGIFTSPVTLDPAKSYDLTASGTFLWTSGSTNWADAEYWWNNGVRVEGSTPYVLDISIDAFGTDINWGTYNSLHVYEQTVTGYSTISFGIYDSYFGDNSGYLTVEIKENNW